MGCGPDSFHVRIFGIYRILVKLVILDEASSSKGIFYCFHAVFQDVDDYIFSDVLFVVVSAHPLKDVSSSILWRILSVVASVRLSKHVSFYILFDTLYVAA